MGSEGYFHVDEWVQIGQGATAGLMAYTIYIPLRER